VLLLLHVRLWPVAMLGALHLALHLCEGIGALLGICQHNSLPSPHVSTFARAPDIDSPLAAAHVPSCLHVPCQFLPSTHPPTHPPTYLPLSRLA
jgi:hypothetical protein